MSLEPRLLSVGDRIEKGRYSLHSRFRHAVNFVKDNGRTDRVITVADERVRPGPSYLIFTSLPDDGSTSLWIGRREVRIGENTFEFDDSLIYSSRADDLFKWKKYDPSRFRKDLRVFEECLRRNSHPKSLVFLTDKNTPSELDGTFETIFAQRFVDGMDLLFHGDTVKGLNRIKGSGSGLTPAGDDFIVGLLSGLYIFERTGINDTDISETGPDRDAFLEKMRNTREKIYRICRSENPISSTFLYFAYQGLFDRRSKALIRSLFQGSERDIRKCTVDFISVGETSGSDTATGLLTTLRKGVGIWLEKEF